MSTIAKLNVDSPLSNEITNPSSPSVVASAVAVNVNESVVPTTKLPVKEAPAKSALVTPVIV